MTNLQAIFHIKAGDRWECYCREPVASLGQARGMAHTFARRFDEETRVLIQDWSKPGSTSTVLDA